MTTFNVPLKTQGTGGNTGNSQTETSGFVSARKVVSLGATGGNVRRAIITLPPFSSLLTAGGFSTSAFAADVSAAFINFGNSADATHYGVIAVSAVGQLRNATVSAGGEFDSGGTIVVTVSAVSTTTFTAGGVRAFVEYLTIG